MRVGAALETFAVPVYVCVCARAHALDLVHMFSHFYILRWQQRAVPLWKGDHIWRRHERACHRLVARTHPGRHGENIPSIKKEEIFHPSTGTRSWYAFLYSCRLVGKQMLVSLILSLLWLLLFHFFMYYLPLYMCKLFCGCNWLDLTMFNLCGETEVHKRERMNWSWLQSPREFSFSKMPELMPQTLFPSLYFIIIPPKFNPPPTPWTAKSVRSANDF